MQLDRWVAAVMFGSISLCAFLFDAGTVNLWFRGACKVAVFIGLAEHEMADRGRRRMERHLTEARLPAGKTLATFEFDSVLMVSKA